MTKEQEIKDNLNSYKDRETINNSIFLCDPKGSLDESFNSKKYIFHVDMSGRFYRNENIGIAIFCAKTKMHRGCAIKKSLILRLKKDFFKGNSYNDSAKLYSICIFILVEDIQDKINSLIICNDEDFTIVKKMLNCLLSYSIEIINITEFRKRMGRNLGSLADNYARVYRKRGLKPNHLKGKKLNTIQVNFNIIKKHWEELENIR